MLDNEEERGQLVEKDGDENAEGQDKEWRNQEEMWDSRYRWEGERNKAEMVKSHYEER